MRNGFPGRSLATGLLLLLVLSLASCGDDGIEPPPPPKPDDEIEDPIPPPPPPPPLSMEEAERLFDLETFGGNGRTCLTCHSKESGTITREDVARRLAADPNDPLFRHDGLDNGVEGVRRILGHATIRVEIPLPPFVRLADNPDQRTIVVKRGVPTTMNAPALDGRGRIALMLDLRDADLRDQALGAIRSHAQNTIEPTHPQLDALAMFQQTDPRFFSSGALHSFANGGPEPELPEGNNESESRGRLFFIDTPMTPGSKAGACAICHSGPNLNEVSVAGAAAIPGGQFAAGAKFGNVRVAETNANDNPTLTFLVDGPGGTRTIVMADPGIMLTPRLESEQMTAFIPANAHPADFAGFFKTPSLWGIFRTSPYFHDNSAKTLREVVDHYADVFFKEELIAGGIINLTEQDRQDIVAFLERL
jgi:hypothetical protein